MLFNIFAEPVTNMYQRKQKTLKKLSTILKMSYSIHNGHYQQQSHMEMAEQFRTAYSLKSTSLLMQKNLIDEEYFEFCNAFKNESFENQLKELADHVYVCYQYAAAKEWDLDVALTRVHRSNLSKLDEYGKPILRGDGKILKGPAYQPPNLQDLIND